MGNGFSHFLGKGSRSSFHLGGLEQMAAGFMEDHPAKTVGHHHGHLTAIDVFRVEHRGRTGADLLGAGVHIPFLQIPGTVCRSVAPPDAGSMFSVGGQHAQAAGLMQTDVAGKCAVTGGHEHFLPVA